MFFNLHIVLALKIAQKMDYPLITDEPALIDAAATRILRLAEVTPLLIAFLAATPSGSSA